MVALLAVFGLVFSLAIPGPRLLTPGPASAASLTSNSQPPCPPCADQLPQGAQVIGTASAPPDANGTTETLVAYFVRDPGFSNLELGRMGAVAVRSTASDRQVYQLGDDLGETPYADLTARDLTGDGAAELAVVGGIGAHSSLMHIFRWNGAGYALVEEFFGDSGVRLADLEGDGVYEVIVGVRHYDRAQTRSDTVLRWAGAAYSPAYTEWGFTFSSPEFHDYPEAAVLKYYLSIDRRDFRTAWNLLGPSMQASQTYESFVAGFSTTHDVRVEDLELTDEGLGRATVRVELSSAEHDGSIRRFESTWICEQLGGSWRLAGAYVVEL